MLNELHPGIETFGCRNGRRTVRGRLANSPFTTRPVPKMPQIRYSWSQAHRCGLYQGSVPRRLYHQSNRKALTQNQKQYHVQTLGRGDRVVDCAALEMPCPGNWTVGSNPTLSADFARAHRSSKFALARPLQRPIHGGSYPPGSHGWQRETRRKPRATPLKSPYFRSDSTI